MSDLNKLKEIDYSDIPIGYKAIILSLIERAETAEAELARRDEAAGEPVALRWRFIPPWPDIPVMAWTYIDNPKYFSDVRGMEGAEVEEVFTAAQPSALPPEIVRNINGLGFYQGRLIFGGAVGWYNQAIADAKALGCKAIKLPEKLKWDYNDGVTKDEVYSFNNAIDACAVSLRKDGFTVEGE